tara:strand:+ start:266 stop:514 length:249 start_codon:yes stop_codon:yes gene_type:complete
MRAKGQGRPRHESPTEKLEEIIKFHWNTGATLKETSDKFGVSKQYVSQEEAKWRLDENRKLVRRGEAKTKTAQDGESPSESE